MVKDAEELAYWYWLTDVKGIGPVISRRLLDQFRHPYQVYQSSAGEILERTGVKKHLVSNIELAKRSIARYIRLARQQLEIADKLGGRILTCNEGLYGDVYRRYKGDDALPTIIHVLGNENHLNARRFAIVGTRHPSAYGQGFAHDLAYDLASRGISVISGLALGIDAQAHTGALEAGGATIAILGCGADIAYPPENIGLYRQILGRGLLLSEFPFGVRITSENLRKRNRTIVAFSEGTIVAECPIKSGAMIAARFTVQQNKPLFSFRYRNEVDNSGGMWLIDHHLALELTGPSLHSLETALTQYEGRQGINVDKVFEELWPKKRKPAKITGGQVKVAEVKKAGVHLAEKGNVPVSDAKLEGIQEELPIGEHKQALPGGKSPVQFDFKEGDMVRHPTFGEGQVVKIAAMQGDFQVTIRFSSRKVQNFLWKYANLTHVT